MSIITLSIGEISNHICTNLFNIEVFLLFFYQNPEINSNTSLSNINNSYFFNKKSKIHGFEYTPKLISLSLKGEIDNFSSITNNKKNINEKDIDKNIWNGKIEKYDSIKSNRIVDPINYKWYDYSIIPYNSNMFIELDNNPVCLPFDDYSIGIDTFVLFYYYQNEKQGDKIYDSIRKEMENSDVVYGFHVLTDIYNGWGGISSKIYDYLHVDNPKTPLISIVNENKSYVENDIHRSKSIAFSLYDISEYSTIILPFDLNINYNLSLCNINQDSLYHKTSIIANSLHAITTPYIL